MYLTFILLCISTYSFEDHPEESSEKKDEKEDKKAKKEK